MLVGSCCLSTDIDLISELTVDGFLQLFALFFNAAIFRQFFEFLSSFEENFIDFLLSAFFTFLSQFFFSKNCLLVD
jgi:hypothetical protein